MKRFRQFQPLVIEELEATRWLHPVRQRNHYEMIFIKRGAGKHQTNGYVTDYSGHDLFLIGPDDEHSFTIESPTRFVFIKFTDIYLHQAHPAAYGLQHLEYLIKSKETHLTGFALSTVDRRSATHMVNVMLSLRGDILINEQLIWLQILALATLMQRNMPELKATAHRSRDMQAVFCYIHKYVYTPEKLKATAMAEHFNTTPDYIGPYFKRNAGVTLRDYIADYRKILIQQRLGSGNYSLKQVAAEFGLTDESHVRKVLL